MRSKLLSLGLCAFAALTGFAVPQDYYFMFETFGEDCYADGTPLLEGECYALVWRHNDVKDQLEGLLRADGTPVDSEKCQVLWIFPTAERASYTDPSTQTEITYAYSKRAVVGINKLHLSNYGSKGIYSLFLLDTRIWDGTKWVVGGKTSETTVAALNGYGVVTDLEQIKQEYDGGTAFMFMYDTLRYGEPSLSLPEDEPQLNVLSYGDWNVQLSRSDAKAVLPTECPTPAFSALAVTNGVATVSVTNTANYLTYGLSMANEFSKINSVTNFVGGFKQGVGAQPLTWEIDVKAYQQGFFKILRKSVLDN